MSEDRLEKIDNLLKKREADFPVRGEAFFASKKEIDEYAGHLLKSVGFEHCKPDKNLLEKIGKFVKNPIFICGPMKSGTSLVVNLLDGNKNIVALPGDSHYFRKFRNFEGDFSALVKYWVVRMINPTGQSPFWFLDRDGENYRKFLLYLHHFTTIEKMKPFLAVVAAVFAANPSQAENPLYFLEKTPNNENFADELLADFPEAKFIHVVRDPLSNIASLKKLFRFRKWKFSAPFLTTYIKNSWTKAEKNQKKIGKNAYHILRYEELLKNCPGEMEKVCLFLNIQYDENLCVPTINRRPAKANSMYKNERASGEIVTHKRDKWETELTDAEKRTIVSTLFSDAVSLGYDWNEKRVKKFFKPGYELFFKFLYFFYGFCARLKRI